MSKNRGKSKLSKNVLFNANKHVFHCEKSLGTFYGQPSYLMEQKMFKAEVVFRHPVYVSCMDLEMVKPELMHAACIS
jgi:hypothetical protein